MGFHVVGRFIGVVGIVNGAEVRVVSVIVVRVGLSGVESSWGVTVSGFPAVGRFIVVVGIVAEAEVRVVSVIEVRVGFSGVE